MTTITSLCIELLSNSRTPDMQNLDGKNLSPHPAIGVFFNGYGEDEETGEPTDVSVEKYKVVIHSNSIKPKFSLPTKDRVQLGTVFLDSSDEVEINAVYDLQDKSWHINDFSNDESTVLSHEDVTSTLKKILSKSKVSKQPPTSSDWPFAIAPTPSKTKK